MAHQLVINADDLGYSEERDRGIFECFQDNRSISDCSVLANGTTSQKALLHARQIRLPVGLHFNLTEGKPLSPAENLPTLTANGLFLGRLPFMDKIKARTIDSNEITGELLAQIKWYTDITGSLPHHIDGHQHIHVMPSVREALADAMKKKGIKWTRLPQEICDHSECSNPLQYVLSQCQTASEIFSRHDVNFTDCFIGISVMGRKMAIKTISSALKRNLRRTAKNQTIEFMVHPGYKCKGSGGCGSGPDDFSMSAEREHEMNMLRSGEWKKLQKDFTLEVCSYNEL